MSTQPAKWRDAADPFAPPLSAFRLKEELERFLEGYRAAQPFSAPAFRYYYILSALWFYGMGDAAYQAELRKILERLTARGQ